MKTAARPGVVAAASLWLCLAALPVAADRSLPAIGVGATASYTTAMTTSWLSHMPPFGGELYVRLFDTVEAGVFGTMESEDSVTGSEKYWTILVGLELRLAPSGRFYRPYAGLGVAYAYERHYAADPGDTMVCAYVTIAPLRFSLRPLFRYRANIHPTVSILRVRYGPIYFDGSLPSNTDRGNFLVTLELVGLGVYLGR